MSFSWARPYEPKHPMMRWLDERLPLPRLVYGAIGGGYPVPRNLNYFWNFGVLAGIFLTIQIVTGIVLAMHYFATVDGAFNSVNGLIMRDVNAGWLLRYAHMNGASFFFIVTYIHIFRGLYYGSYKAPRELVWMLGLVIYLLMVATGFMGYVLPWGQMSYWGAQVITGFFSAFPLIAEDPDADRLADQRAGREEAGKSLRIPVAHLAPGKDVTHERRRHHQQVYDEAEHPHQLARRLVRT